MCEIATPTFFRTGSKRDILQIRKTSLQCRQQVAKGLSSGPKENRGFKTIREYLR